MALSSITNLLNGPYAPFIGDSIGGAIRVAQGSSMVIQGGAAQASAYRTAGAGSLAAANYNVQLDKIQTNRALSSSARQVSRVLGQQRVEASASGLSISSKSTLAVMNETLDAFSREALNLRTDASQRQAAIMFQGESAQVESENRARMATFQAESQRAQAFGGLVSGMFTQGLTLLGGS